jgi:hypothetical protein
MYWEEKLKAAQTPVCQEVSRQLSVLQINTAFEAKTLPDCDEWFSSRYSGRPDAEVKQMYYEVLSLLPTEQQPSKLPPAQGQKRKAVSFSSVTTPSPTKGKQFDRTMDGALFDSDHEQPELQLHTPQSKVAASTPESTEKHEDPTGKGTECPILSKEPIKDHGEHVTEETADATDNAADDEWPVSVENFEALGCKLEIIPSFGPCAISIVTGQSTTPPHSDGAVLSLQEHVAAKKRRGQTALVHDFSKGQVLAIVKFSTTAISTKMYKNMPESERSAVLYQVGLKSANRIVRVPNGEIDHQTAQSPDLLFGPAGKLLSCEGKSFRSADIYVFKSDCIASQQFLVLLDKYTFSAGQEVVPAVSLNEADGSIKVLGLAVCASRRITMYRLKFMPLCEPKEEGLVETATSADS